MPNWQQHQTLVGEGIYIGVINLKFSQSYPSARAVNSDRSHRSPINAEMTYFVVSLVSILLFGSSYVDGPTYPPLDLMLQILCKFQTYIGINHVSPMMLTFVPSDPVLSQFTDWFTVEVNTVLAFLILGLSYISIFYLVDWIGSHRKVFSPIDGDEVDQAKVLKFIRCHFKDNPLNGKAIGQITNFRPRKGDKELLQQDLYGFQVLPAAMDQIRSSRRKMAYMRRTFSVRMELYGDFIILSGHRTGVDASYTYLKRNFFS